MKEFMTKNYEMLVLMLLLIIAFDVSIIALDVHEVIGTMHLEEII